MKHPLALRRGAAAAIRAHGTVESRGKRRHRPAGGDDGTRREARAAGRTLALSSDETRSKALRIAASAVRERADEILAANARDVVEARQRGTAPAFVDRLVLDEGRLEGVARGLDTIAALPDPVGLVLETFKRPNGLVIERVAVPLGVIGIIYESRPAVTADAGALCLKAGNAAILRGGSESFHSASLIHACLVDGLRAAGLPEAAINPRAGARPRGRGPDARRARRARSTSSCRAAARASSPACRPRPACRSSPISKGVVHLYVERGPPTPTRPMAHR